MVEESDEEKIEEEFPSDHQVAKDKFNVLLKALDYDSNGVQFREHILKAYGIPEKQAQQLDSDMFLGTVERILRPELDFALDCLKGIGGGQSKILSSKGNLNEVMLIELGTHQRPPQIPNRPWLMGDWHLLAQLIVYWSQDVLQTDIVENDDFEKHTLKSSDIVRVWPTTSWTPTEIGTGAKGHLVEVGLEEVKKPVLVRSKKRTWDEDDYNWVVLPTGPGRLTYPDGIPAHMWTGFRLDDGM